MDVSTLTLQLLLSCIILLISGGTPSKIHDLLRLTSEALILNLEDDILKFLDGLNDVYYDTRYPLHHEELLNYINIDKAEEILQETKRIFVWLEKK